MDQMNRAMSALVCDCTRLKAGTVRSVCVAFRAPKMARQVDLNGKTITTLVIDDDAVLVEVTAYEICDIAVEFETFRS